MLSDNGHYWVGMDISQSMLDIATERECEGDLVLNDMGNGAPFRAGSFDGAIRYLITNNDALYSNSNLINWN